jgi:[ribosomal protein S18]-alanine N-acetyltransferase
VDGRVSGSRKRPPLSVTIRAAAPADVDFLLDIENAVFPTDRLDRRAFRHAIRSPTIICLVAKRRAEVLGYVTVERRRTSSIGRLTSIAVAPRAAGARVGRRLLAAAEKAARAAALDRLRLEVRADNARARRLYEGTGYRMLETLDDYYEDGAAALRYEKALTRR